MRTVPLLLVAGCMFVTSGEYDARFDLDGDGAPWPDDCAPDDPAVHPGATEVCGNGLDEDCAGGDEACTEGDADTDADTDADADADSDADTDPATGDTGCAGPDADGDLVPDACDGCPDEPTLTVPATLSIDGDGDGFGADGETCDPLAVPARPGDCDDGDLFVSPIAPEVPGNAVDESCDGVVSCFLDADGDGLGDIEGPVAASADADCADPGESTSATDCDDGEAAVGAGGCADQPPIAVLSVFAGAVEAGDTVHLSAQWSTDAEDLPGTLEVRFDLEGDGVFDTAFSTNTEIDTSYAGAGLKEPVVEVRDAAGHLSWSSGVVAVAPSGALLVVDTDADDNHPEPYGGPYTAGLSLREALTLAAATGGAQVISFADRFALEPNNALPAVTGADTTVAGVPWLVLDGATAGGTGLSLAADRATVVGLHLTGWGVGISFGGGENVARAVEIDDSAVTFSFGADDARVVGCDLHDNPSVQLQVTRRASIEGARIRGGTSGVVIDGAADATEIRGCTITGATDDCVVVSNQADNVVITDTTIAGCANDGVDASTTADGLVLLNTIVAANGESGVEDGNFAAGSADHVLWFDNAAGDCTGCAIGTNALQVDPAFVAPAVDDYRLRGGSAAIDAGVATGFDRNGAAPGTVAGGGPDYGAAER